MRFILIGISWDCLSGCPSFGGGAFARGGRFSLFILAVGCGDLVWVGDKPFVQDQIYGRSQNNICCHENKLRCVSSVLGVNRQWDLEAFATLGFEAVFIALVDDILVGKQGLGYHFDACMKMMQV